MKIITGNEQEFFSFLNNITKKDRVAVISHNDLDGVASVVLMNAIFREKKIEPNLIVFIDYKKGMFEPIYEKLKKEKISKSFFLDINESSDPEGFAKIRKEIATFLIDHHPSDIKEENVIKTRTEDCATFVLYQLGKEKFDFEKWKWLVCATMISEFSYNFEENFNFIKQNYPDVNINDMYNSAPGKIANLISSALIYFSDNKKKVFDMIDNNDFEGLEKYAIIVGKEFENMKQKYKKEAEYFPGRKLYIYYYTPKFSISSAVVTALSVEEPDKTFIIASDVRKRKEFVQISSRNQSGNVNLNLLMRKATAGFENATTGGHVKAAGGNFMKKDWEKFKKNLLNL